MAENQGRPVSRNPLTEDQIVEFCRARFGRSPDAISYPGGRGRKTVILTLGKEQYALSKRASSGRAALEAEALRTLAPTGSVPKLVAHEGDFVLQSVVAGTRLTQALEDGDANRRTRLLSEAAETLIGFQEITAKRGLTHSAPRIGNRDNWYRDFAKSPIRLADQFGQQLTSYNVDEIEKIILPVQSAFVKWDARPGNAVVHENRSIWFDWEHCGVGSIEDDLVWLFADEWSPIAHEVQAESISGLAELHGSDEADLARRFAVKAVLHSCIRLELIFRRKAQGGWWNPVEAMAHDRVGVTRGHVKRVCIRAHGICEKFDVLHPISDLFQEVLKRADP